MALARESDRPIELLASHSGIEHRLSVHQPLEIDVMRHEADRCPDSRAFDERHERFGVLLHLEHRGHAAADQLRDGEAAQRLALVATHHHAHRQIEAVGGRVADILGAAPEHRVSEVVVCADEAGQRDASLRVDGLASRRRARGNLVARPDFDDARPRRRAPHRGLWIDPASSMVMSVASRISSVIRFLRRMLSARCSDGKRCACPTWKLA